MKRPNDVLPEFVRDALGSSSPSDDAHLSESLASLASALEPVLPSAEARRRLLAAVSASPERHAPLFERLSRFFELPVERVRAILSEVEMPSRWEAAPLPGVALMHFSGGPGLATADVGLVRLDGGLLFPMHRHLGTERVMVIEGGYHDDAGRFYGPGDEHEMHEGTVHSYKVLDDQRCLLALVLYRGVELVTP